MDDLTRSGLVVARHRRHVTVETGGAEVLCQSGKRSLTPLVGDEVRWIPEPDGHGTVIAIEPRRSVLTRIDNRGRCELVAANLTHLTVVAAPAPEPDWLVVDHYLVAAERTRLDGRILFNKLDLGRSPPRHLDCYRRAGYPVHSTSASTRAGLDQLAEAFRHGRGAMVGQSGVGKSSLLNALLGDRVQDVGELTGKGAHGRHTTSSARLYRLDNGGELIDAPGVRAYAPYIQDVADLQHGFREFRAYLGQCRFDNCQHLAEPGCAIKAAVDARDICTLRYQSYQRLHGIIVSLQSY